jgi:hypothetical protein
VAPNSEPIFRIASPHESFASDGNGRFDSRRIGFRDPDNSLNVLRGNAETTGDAPADALEDVTNGKVP